MDYQRLPKRTVAALVSGLRDDARLVKKYENRQAGQRDILLAVIADRLGVLTSAMAGTKMPDSITEVLLNMEPEKKTNVMAFDTPEAFYIARYGKEGKPCQVQH